MTTKPDYFETIRDVAADLWAQLEGNRRLAGPWHQLFKQVQSPTHVLSELLQNADDAGASQASVRIAGNRFTFAHNGRDFTKDEFDSLCSFGNSNKRVLHTIGFRGIGFRSTFSLGDTVELQTPTLSVEFAKRRFTEPKWVEPKHAVTGTEIRVNIIDPKRQRELEASLDAWIESPTSLLFFNNIRRLRVGDHDLRWRTVAPGPVSDSKWVALDGSDDQALLIASSSEEAFPADALEEIKQERSLGDDDLADFPPCKVDIVLGIPGVLYVVLPTGVRTPLPFACNAPFIQDPARIQIKSPDTSPTNRWLLARAGKLAAETMNGWLKNDALSDTDRANAYGLLPDSSSPEGLLAIACTELVSSTFDAEIDGVHLILTDDGTLVVRGQGVFIPADLLEVWPDGRASTILDSAQRPALSRHITPQHRALLLARTFVSETSRADVMDVLEATAPPKPKNWRRLLALWNYLAPGLSRSRASGRERNLRIVPTHGSNVLHGSAGVVRLGEKRVLHSEADWAFLSDNLHVADPRWFRFLADTRRRADKGDGDASREIDGALSVLAATGLDEPSDADKIIDRVASTAFQRTGILVSDCVRLAQIAAKLRVTVGESFRFVTKDVKLRDTTATVVLDLDGELERDLPPDWCSEHLLHADYTTTFAACTSDEWARWVSSGSARLHRFPPLVQSNRWLWGRAELESWLRSRGSAAPDRYPYKSENFQIHDWDFGERFWDHWTGLASNDVGIWGRVVQHLLSQRTDFWSKSQAPSIAQIGGGYSRTLTIQAAIPTWIAKLRQFACLPDRTGVLRKPGDLLRYTAETEPLLTIEPFVDLGIDNEANRPLLKLLGVGEVPNGPRRLLDELRSVSHRSPANKQEVAGLYTRLDAISNHCSTTDFAQIESTFRLENLVLTEGGEWVTTSDVYLAPVDGELFDGRTILALSRGLALWRKIGVTEHATPEHAIGWLRTLQPNVRLEREVASRIESLLHQHGLRVWEECGHWLTLAQTWVPAETLRYSVSMGSLTRLRDLHDWVKEKTADLKPLTKELLAIPPFSALSPLAACIEERVREDQVIVIREERREWLSRLGAELSRMRLRGDEEAGHATSHLASELAETTWRIVRSLELTPYIDGVEAGVASRGSAKWVGRRLYVEDRAAPKLASAVADELGRSFRSDKIADAIKFCYDRPPRFVTEYMEENFDLIPKPRGASLLDVAESVSLGTVASPADNGAGLAAAGPLPTSSATSDTPPGAERDTDRRSADLAIARVQDRLAARLRSDNGLEASDSTSANDQRGEQDAPSAIELPPLAEVKMTEVALDGELKPDVTVHRSLGRPGFSRATDNGRNDDALVGRRGEELVLDFERRRVSELGFSETRVVWSADDDPNADHDIRSVDDDGGDLWIEVKSTVARGRHFFWSIAEFERAVREGRRYAIYRVYEAATKQPRLAVVRDPIERLARDEMRLEVEGFQGELPSLGSIDALDM